MIVKVKRERMERRPLSLRVVVTPAGVKTAEVLGWPETAQLQGGNEQVNTFSSTHKKIIVERQKPEMWSVFSENRTDMNGHDSRSSRREHHRDSEGATSQGSDGDDQENITARRSLKRKTARAAVTKIKLLEASDEDYEDQKPKSSSSRLRQTTRSSKRTAVIQSSSDSDGNPSARGRRLPFSTILSPH